MHTYTNKENLHTLILPIRNFFCFFSQFLAKLLFSFCLALIQLNFIVFIWTVYYICIDFCTNNNTLRKILFRAMWKNVENPHYIFICRYMCTRHLLLYLCLQDVSGIFLLFANKFIIIVHNFFISLYINF